MPPAASLEKNFSPALYICMIHTALQEMSIISLNRISRLSLDMECVLCDVVNLSVYVSRFKGKGKCKVHPRIGHEGPEGE
jgi:hypothetical protein